MPKETTPKATRFGVFQMKEGSYSIADTTFSAKTVTPVDPETESKACPDTSPVKFFASEEAAQENLAKLIASWSATRQ